MYVIVSGGLTVSKDGQVLVRVTPGNTVGEIGFINASQRLATIAANKKSVVYKLTRYDYDKIAESISKHTSKIPLFTVLKHEDKRKLEEHLKIASYSKGEVIIRRIDTAENFFILLRGQVDIGKKSLGQYEYFGEHAVGSSSAYGFTAVAKKDCTLLVLSAVGFRSPCFHNVAIMFPDEERVEPSRDEAEHGDRRSQASSSASSRSRKFWRKGGVSSRSPPGTDDIDSLQEGSPISGGQAKSPYDSTASANDPSASQLMDPMQWMNDLSNIMSPGSGNAPPAAGDRGGGNRTPSSQSQTQSGSGWDQISFDGSTQWLNDVGGALATSVGIASPQPSSASKLGDGAGGSATSRPRSDSASVFLPDIYAPSAEEKPTQADGSLDPMSWFLNAMAPVATPATASAPKASSKANAKAPPKAPQKL